MLAIDSTGMCAIARIRPARQINIERRPMTVIRGIVVHQTDSPTTESTLHSYKTRGAAGAHFLIDKDGTIYQTASLHMQTWHVGLLKSRCLVEKQCSLAEMQSLRTFNPRLEDQREQAKHAPDRFPANRDSIGIELVGEALPRGPNIPDDKRKYETVTSAQNAALKWLVHELSMELGVPMHEVFRHPDVSRKNRTEASTAQW